MAKKDAKSLIEELIELNEKLKESPFDPTSLEILKETSEDVAKAMKLLDNTMVSVGNNIDNLNVGINGLFKDKSKLLDDIDTVQKKIDELEKNGQRQAAKDLKKELENLKDSASNYYNLANKEQKLLNKRIVEGTHKLDDWNEKWKQKTHALRKGFSEINTGAKQMYNAVTKTLNPWMKANDEAMKYARNMGMSQKTADAYLKRTVDWAAKNNIGILFNKSTDELIKLQNKYSEILGRNVQLTSSQKKDMLAMEKFLGEEGMMDIANNLENFGMGMSDSAEFVKKTFDTATKAGISASKLTHTIRQNIKMAQDYSFQKGLDGLTSMAKKAIALKADMSFVNGFIDKVSTVEGAITTGANLQVLGGTYSMGSDPLSMLYESLNNVEGLFDRAVNMTKGKVFYNSHTGNFEMGAQDRYLMKQAATQMGVDPSKMIDVAFRKASLTRIENQARTNSTLSNDKDMMEMVKNLATWENGNAVVDIDGKSVKVSDLTSEHKEKLEAMQRNDSQNLQEMAISLRSSNELLQGIQKEIANEQNTIIGSIGRWLTNLGKSSTETLNTISKIGSWFNVINGTHALLTGILGVTSGIWGSMKGAGNLFMGNGRNTGKARNFGNFKKRFNNIGNWYKNVKGTTLTYNGTQYTNLGNGTLTSASGTVSGKRAQAIIRSGKMNFKGVGFKGVLKNFSKVGKVGGIAAASSLTGSAIDGTLQKDIETAGTRVIAATAGSIIGGMFGPWGAILGGMAAEAVTRAFEDSAKESRNALREKIASEIKGSMGHLSGLFSGDKALEGNYSESQLETIKNILKDNKIEENELSGFTGWLLKRKLTNNKDLIKMRDSGVDVRVAMASGGRLKGNSHANGGMPILGSNIVVEGGEYVVNKKATEANLPLLEAINSNDYKMTAKEPLGKQMTVSKHGSSNGYSMPHNSKIELNPISINLSGTIKLDSGNKQVDITNELLNNPVLVNKLVEMVNKQLNVLDFSAYNKGKFKQKFY